MTHDLRTPLQAFTFELENLLNECQNLNAPNKLPEFKTMLRDNISHLNVIVTFMTMAINRSLDYTKVSTGVELVPSISQIDIADTISWIMTSLTHKVRKTVDIVVDPLPDNVNKMILTDKQWFIENVFCYLSNALKFTLDGEIRVRFILDNAVHVDQAPGVPPKSMLRVEVEDSGIGLTNSQKKELFHAFKQAQSCAGGTGLGLFALRKRVANLGGECGVRDRDCGQCGSVFWFSFPYVPDYTIAECSSPIPCFQEVAAVVPNKGIATVNSRRILVVDDSPLIQKATRKMLEREGYMVEIANNGYECLKLINSKNMKFDLILLDLHMPIMDGLETVSRLREQEFKNRFGYVDETGSHVDSRDIPMVNIVVGFSGNSDDETKSAALEAGMDAFLPKPLRAEDLRHLASYITKTTTV